MGRKISDLHISCSELARRMGINPTTLKNQIIDGTFPIGYAAKKKGGGVAIHIPREPAEYYLKTGRFPTV